MGSGPGSATFTYLMETSEATEELVLGSRLTRYVNHMNREIEALEGLQLLGNNIIHSTGSVFVRCLSVDVFFGDQNFCWTKSQSNTQSLKPFAIPCNPYYPVIQCITGGGGTSSFWGMGDTVWSSPTGGIRWKVC